MLVKSAIIVVGRRPASGGQGERRGEELQERAGKVDKCGERIRDGMGKIWP